MRYIMPWEAGSVEYMQLLTLDNSPTTHIHVSVTAVPDEVSISITDQGESAFVARGVRVTDDERLVQILTGLVAGRVWSGWARLKLFGSGEEWKTALAHAAQRAAKNCNLG